MKAKNGVRTLTLEVDINNSKAVNLYEKQDLKRQTYKEFHQMEMMLKECT